MFWEIVFAIFIFLFQVVLLVALLIGSIVIFILTALAWMWLFFRVQRRA